MRATIAVLGAGLFMLGCRIEAPFVRENPFDRKGDVQMSLSGPDSTYSVLDEFQVTIQSSVPLPPPPVSLLWASSSPNAVLSLGDGRFRVLNASADYTLIGIEARFNDNIVARTMQVGQRVASLTLSCTAGTFTPCPPITRPAQLVLRGIMFDASGAPVAVPAAAFRRATVISRAPGLVYEAHPRDETGVLRFDVDSVGETYVVVTIDGVTDSILVRVEALPPEWAVRHQRVRSAPLRARSR